MKKSSILFILILLTGLFSAEVSAHDWYSYSCCGGNDCHPINCTELIETTKGMTWNGYEFSKDMIHPSQDNHCHVCISEFLMGDKIQHTPHCAYIQQGS